MRAESEVMRRAVILGPGRPGFLQVDLGARRGSAGERIAEVDANRVPAALRLPNTHVVAVMGPEGVLRVDDGPEALAKAGVAVSFDRSH